MHIYIHNYIYIYIITISVLKKVYYGCRSMATVVPMTGTTTSRTSSKTCVSTIESLWNGEETKKGDWNRLHDIKWQQHPNFLKEIVNHPLIGIKYSLVQRDPKMVLLGCSWNQGWLRTVSSEKTQQAPCPRKLFFMSCQDKYAFVCMYARLGGGRCASRKLRKQNHAVLFRCCSLLWCVCRINKMIKR